MASVSPIGKKKMENKNGHSITYSEGARKSFQDKAEAWNRRQAARLGVSCECILGAIKRGHLPEAIEAMADKHPLELAPPCGIKFATVGR